MRKLGAAAFYVLGALALLGFVAAKLAGHDGDAVAFCGVALGAFAHAELLMR